MQVAFGRPICVPFFRHVIYWASQHCQQEPHLLTMLCHSSRQLGIHRPEAAAFASHAVKYLFCDFQDVTFFSCIGIQGCQCDLLGLCHDSCPFLIPYGSYNKTALGTGVFDTKHQATYLLLIYLACGVTSALYEYLATCGFEVRCRINFPQRSSFARMVHLWLYFLETNDFLQDSRIIRVTFS